jgi:triosephosphate isomerase (TIM)
MKHHNLVVANWKMNPQNLLEAKKVFNGIKKSALGVKNVLVCVCPPFPYLHTFSKLSNPKNFYLGAQDLSSSEKGAHTGEVSAEMIKDARTKYVIVGHSERRASGETNEIVRKKMERAFLNKLTPILCIGEKERDHDASYLGFIKTQIKECLSTMEKKDLIGLIIAYEPIWAIGKSYKESMNPTDIHEMTLIIKKIAGEIFGKDIANSFKILYGGSVEPENAPSIIEYGNVDGFLVGHASLDPIQFSKILKSADVKK